MTSDLPQLSAEERVAEARARLSGTVGAIQARLDPRTLARDAMDNATRQGSQALISGADAVRRNPAKAAGVTALILAVANHRSLLALGRKLWKNTAPERPKPVARAKTPAAQPQTRARVKTPRRATTRKKEI